MNKNRGFTLVELLVVIAIIAILAVVVVLVLNPTELLRQSRDSSRLSDLSSLKNAIQLYLTDSSPASVNLASTSPPYGYSACYVSTVSGNGTSSLNCGMFANAYANIGSTTAANYKKNNALGWIPVNLQLTFGSPLGNLPVDPTNNLRYYYSYAATTTGGNYFEVDSFIESQKYGFNGPKDVVSTDGGNNTSTLEMGNVPGLSL